MEDQSKPQPIVVKAALIGEAQIGKTSILLKSSDNVFSENYLTTIGVDFKITRSQDGKFKFQIWDTAGQERFRTITSSYYRGTHIFGIVYDVTNRDSFNSVQQFFEAAKKESKPTSQFLLIGNKTDLPNRQVQYGEGQDFAQKNEMFFLEISAKNDPGHVFLDKLEEIASKMELEGAFEVKAA